MPSEAAMASIAQAASMAVNVVDNVDKAKFVAALTTANAQFEKDFGKANLDRIRNFK